MLIKSYKQFEAKEDIDPYGEEEWDDDLDIDDPITRVIILNMIRVGFNINVISQTENIDRTKGEIKTYAIYREKDNHLYGLYSGRSMYEVRILCAIDNNNEEIFKRNVASIFEIVNPAYLNAKIEILEKQKEEIEHQITTFNLDDPVSVEWYM